MKPEETREVLRRWDPAADASLGDAQRDEIRGALLRQHRSGNFAIHRLSTAIVLLGVLGVAGYLGVRAQQSSVGIAEPAIVAPVAPSVEPLPQRLQIHYATPGGTRIIWTMDSQFSL